MACGMSGYLYEYNVRFRDIMKELNFDYTYDEWAGEHGWRFFNEALARALEWMFGNPGK
jgi:S-formylglutathione hydrolase FrmB